MPAKKHHDRLMDAIAKWTRELDNYPGWKEWTRKKISKTIRFGDDFGRSTDEDIGDFEFSPEVDAQHAIVYGYLVVSSTLHSLKDLEFYFRRYPFRGLPVSKGSHLSNVCEMYFSRFYEYRERTKKLLNAIKAGGYGEGLDSGKFIKVYDKMFESELRERNGVHHHRRFDDIQIDHISLAQTMSKSDGAANVWDWKQRTAYRAATKEWSARVKRRSAVLEEATEVLADLMLRSCPFLSPKAAGRSLENEK